MALSTKNKAGLALAGLLGALDVASYFLSPEPGPGVVGPPKAILVLDLALGIITLIAVVLAFRSASKTLIGTTVIARILSALSAVPAYFVGVPTNVVILVTAFIAATLLSVWLTLGKDGSHA